MKIHSHIKQKPRIEMLPLIDIVFLLLVFFIYAMLSMAVHRGLPVTLPTSAAAKIDKFLTLSVTLKSNGNIYVDKEAVELTELSRVLKGRAQREKEPGVLLFADRTVSYQKLFRVLDQIKKSGIDRISLQAEQDTPQ